MLTFHLNALDGILSLEPSGPLQASDFEALAREVDPYIEKNGYMNGLLIHAPSFPGWVDFAAFLSHIHFVKSHQHYIKRIAAVSDSGILSVLPDIAKHFVQSEIRHFDYADHDVALAWLKGEG